MPKLISGAVDTANINQDRRIYDGRRKMSFKAVQAKMAKKGGYSMERAGAMLASRTRKTMAKHGMSTAHGIPKGVFNKKAFKKGKMMSQHHSVMKSVGAME